MSLFHHEFVRFIGKSVLSRRSFLQHVSAGAVAAGTLNFRQLMSVHADELRKQGRSMILLWMQGGPTQFETFDPKPGTEHGGETKAISTAVPGIQIANGWDHTAKVMDDIALIRSVTNKEGQHQRATYQLHTGYLPTGSVRHPSLGANIAKQLADLSRDLPAVVSVGQTVGSGFLGVDYEPFVVDNPGQLPRNIESPVKSNRYTRRLGLLDKLEDDFAGRGGQTVVDNHRRLYQKASKMVLSSSVKAFDINEEPESVRAKYGDGDFGRGCLLARRLVEQGVTFVEVQSRGWDTHDNLYERVGKLASDVDLGFSALVSDLKERGRLDRTLIVWMGEFGRTPKINPRGGRDHWPSSFNAAIAGGGVRGGQVIGASQADGTGVKDRPVTIPDLFCTVCKSLEVNPRIESISPLGRPLKIVDGGKPVGELFA
jgi:Protein of unknown function (DUF1501)